MNIPVARDLTKNAAARNHITDQWRPLPGATFAPGTLVQLAPLDAQVFVDMLTIQPTPAGAGAKGVVGVVEFEWAGTPTGAASGGFDGQGNIVAGNNPLTRGTTMVDLDVWGQTVMLVDQTGSSQALGDKSALTSSTNSAGYAQATADASVTPPAAVGIASLPAAGLGSNLGSGALAAAAQTLTIAGTPAAGNVIGATLQTSYIQDAPGIVQTKTVTVTLTAATATSATTAAAALVAAINSDPVLSKLYVATNAAGVITITVLATGLIYLYPVSQFFNTSLGTNTRAFPFNTAGVVGNYLTLAAYTSGGGATVTAGGGTFAGGTSYRGYCPAFATPAAGL